MASATNKKPLEFTRKDIEPKSNASEPRRKDFLFYLANGHSIEQAYTLVGVTRKGYENWRRRHKEFPKLVEAARESYRRDIACGLHLAEAYARMLLDAIQRDESLPAPLRYRASKTILTRKGKKDWLPDPIPADTEPLAPYDDEQPDYFTNDFPSEPARSEFESAESHPASSHERSEFESANGATGSCCHGQRESASAARGDAPSHLQAPKGAAAGQPFNPLTPTDLPFPPNPLQNQHNSVVEPVEAATHFSSNPFTSPAFEPTIRDSPESAKPPEPTNCAPASHDLPRNPCERHRAGRRRVHPTYRREPEAGRALASLRTPGRVG